MENNPYYNHLHSLPPQIPPLPPHGRIPQQQTLPQLQSWVPQQQNTVPQHYPQLQLPPMQVQLQQNYNSSATLPVSISTEGLVNVNSTTPPITPHPLDLTTNVNNNLPDVYPFSLSLAPQPQISPRRQFLPQAHYDGNYQNLAACYNDLTQQYIRVAEQQTASSEAFKILQSNEINYKSQLNSYKSHCSELEKELENRNSDALIPPIPISSLEFNNLVKLNKELVTSNEKLRQQNETLKCEEQKTKCEVDRLSTVNRRLTTEVRNLTEQISKEKGNHKRLEVKTGDYLLKTLEEKRKLMEFHKVELETLQKNSNEAELKIRSLNSKMQSLSSKNNELVSENRSYLNTINVLKDENLNVEKTVEILETKVLNLEKKLADSESAKQNQDKFVEGLQSEIKDFKKQLEIYKVRHSNPTQEEDKLIDEIKKRKNALLSARFENKKVVKTATKLEYENKNLREKLESVENKNKKLVETVDTLEGENLYLTKEQECVEEDNEKLSEQIATLKSGNENLLKKEKELNLEVKKQKKDKEVLITKHENEVKQLNEKLNEAENQIKTLSENVQKQQWELEEAKNTFSSNAKEEVESERERKCQKLAHDDYYEIEIERLTRDLNEERAKCARKSEAIAALKKISSGLEADSKRINPLMKQVAFLKSEKDILNRQLDKRLEEMQKLQSTIESLNVQVNELLKSNEDLSLKAIEHTMAIQTLEKKVQENITLIKTQEDEIQNQKVAMSFQEAKSNQQKISNLKKELVEKTKYLKDQEAELNIQRERADFYSRKLTNSDIVNAQLQRELNAEKGENKKAQEIDQQQKEKINELLRKVKDLKEDTDHFSESLREKKWEMRKANEKINKLKHKIRSLNENAIEAEKQEEKSQTSIVELGLQLDRMKSELEQAKLKPFTITSNNNKKNISNPLEEDEDGEDDFPKLPSGIKQTREKKKQTPNHGDAGRNFQPSSKRVRFSFDLNNLDVTEKIDGFKDERFSSDPMIQIEYGYFSPEHERLA
ncbi:unnamed protein product [Orchesella dallaii]|uniref:Uncharacterized protein n=1 Tax=Orchesella dallaii TaxID=48710 RepID=A0ABP1RHW3_9HEXA